MVAKVSDVGQIVHASKSVRLLPFQYYICYCTLTHSQGQQVLSVLSEWNFDLKWVIDQISVPLVVMIVPANL